MQTVPTPPSRCSLTRTGRSREKKEAGEISGAIEGSASEAADVRLGRLGLSTVPSAAAESAFPEGARSPYYLDTTPAGVGTPKGSGSSSRYRPIDRGRKALFPETRAAAAEGALREGAASRLALVRDCPAAEKALKEIPATEMKNVTSCRVIYGDTDQMGVVYYANYLKWFEIGRTELLRRLGLPYTAIEEKRLRFPVTEVSCRYFRPSRYDDVVTIETTLTALGRVTLTFSYRLTRKEDEALIASGWTKHACVDEKGEVAEIPSDLEATLKAAVSGKE